MVSKAIRKKAAKKGAETKRIKRLHAIEDNIRIEKGFCNIAGIDEAGRGPLAGPIVAAACILPQSHLLHGINDSKKLDSDARYKLYQELIMHPDIYYAVGVVEPYEIDQLNIHQANFKAMLLALSRLSLKPDYILVDGRHCPPTDIPSEAIVDGDTLSYCIAAASIIAKVTRDQIMQGYDELYPQYGFKDHKGYGTAEHLQAIQLHGPCPIHRKSFGLLKADESKEITEEELEIIEESKEIVDD